jgi:histidine triad (HIT) family protein
VINMASMDCLFCKFASGEIPVSKIGETDYSFAISDINPQAPTHLLILPKRHVENAAELAIASPEGLADLFNVASALATERDISGYRLVFNTGAEAGQSVFHAHLHLLAGRPFAWPLG